MDQEKSQLEVFLERIQSADDSQKKRWLVVSVGLVSVLVVFLWIANFSFMMSGYTTQVATVSNTDTSAGDASNSPSFFTTIGHGFAAMGRNLSQGAHALGNAFGATREDVVKPP